MQPSAIRQNRTLLLILSAALAVICLCLCVIAAAGLGWLWYSEQDSTPLTLPGAGGDIDQQMDEIQQQVIRLRGLSAASPVTRRLIDNDQLRRNILEDFVKDYTSADAIHEARVLSAFGLLEADFDLFNFYIDLFTEQIAGYYDHETKAMFVVKDTGFNAMERLTYAHEYTHFLQDQAYDIRDGLELNEEKCYEHSERCMGIQALLEGDATFLELQWFDEYATAADRIQMMRSASETQSPVYDSAPAFMKEDFIFPYTQGYAFVEYLYAQDGWSAIDQAYEHPPVSTEQILHPELYPFEIPREITLPDLAAKLGKGWSELEHGVVGEWYTFLILAHGTDPEGRIESETARQATAGWAGDVYAVYLHEQKNSSSLVMISEWDSLNDAREYEQAFIEYLSGRFGQEQNGSWSSPENQHYFMRQGDRTIWLVAPPLQTSSEVWEWLTTP